MGDNITGDQNTPELENLKNESSLTKTVDNLSQPVDKSKKVQGSKKIKKKSTVKPKHGGKRPGAGHPKGKLHAKTLERMRIKAEFEDRVAHHANALFNAQMSLAMGSKFVFKRVRTKTSKGYRWSRFEVVQDPAEIMKFLDGDFKKAENEYFMITTDKPDSKAIDSLLDRSFGKAAQSLTLKDERPDPIAEILKKFDLLDDEGNPTGNDRQAQSSS